METGYQTFAKNFSECCSASSERLAYAQRDQPAYQAAEQQCLELYALLEKKLGEDGKLINRFDAAKNGELAIESEYIYQQGFQDCVYLLRWIGLF